MIAVDASSLVAVVLGERDAERRLERLRHGPAQCSSVSLVEATIAVDFEHARAAVAAWRRFGKGRHPAELNFGDCFSYTVASVASVPLLYKGDDFAQTDVTAAL